MNRLPKIATAAALSLILTASAAADIAGEKILLPAKERKVHVIYFRAPGRGRAHR
jgi:hypothetical protein